MANRNTQRFPSPEEDPRFHDTYQFLRRYRDATYSLKVVVHQMEHQFKLQYDNDIDKFLDSIYAAGADLTGSDIEQRAKSIARSNQMLKLLESSIDLLRNNHKHGEQYYWILYYAFLSPQEAGSIGMRSLPLFYASREIKELGPETTKIRNSRSMGILMAPQCVYVLYNTGNGVLKWEYRTEVRLNAFLQHYLQGYPYNGHPQIRAIMTGTDMEMAFRLFTSTGGYKKSLFMLDTSFEHFHYLPNTPEGEVLLKLLVHPEIMEKLDNLLLSDLGCRSDSIPLEHDATDASGNPILLAYDFDMQRINRFNTGLNVYGRSGNLICFDFQIPVLKKYLTATIHFSSIDLCKFKRGFLHEP